MKWIILLQTSVLLISTVAFAAGTVPVDPITIRVLATNDLHGAVDGVETPELAGTARWLGGFDYLAGLIARLRAEAPDRTIVLDAGDCFQGPLSVNRQEGAPCARFRDLVGYTATTLGNHEFDYQGCGPEVANVPPADPQCALKKTISEGRTPTVVANIRMLPGNQHWQPHGVQPFVVVPVGGIKVGITGILTESAAKMTAPGGMAGLVVIDPVASVRELLPAMRAAGATVIIVLAHMTGDCKGRGGEIAPTGVTRCTVSGELGAFLKAFTPEDIDLVVAGHSHSFIAGTRSGIPVIESLDRGQLLGRAELLVDPVTGRVQPDGIRVLPAAPVCRSQVGRNAHSGKYWKTGSVCSSTYPGWAGIASSEPSVKALRDEVNNSVADICKEVVATAEQDLLHGRGRETALGDLTADLMREASPGADVAFANMGGIRDNLRAGPITMCDLHRIWPFNNRLVEVSMTGEELSRLFSFVVITLHKAVAISGVTVERNRDKGITLRDANGANIDPNRRYRVVTIDFLVNGGDKLDAFFKELPPDRFRTLEFPSYRDGMKKSLLARKVVRRPAGERFKTQP